MQVPPCIRVCLTTCLQTSERAAAHVLHLSALPQQNPKNLNNARRFAAHAFQYSQVLWKRVNMHQKAGWRVDREAATEVG